MIEQKESLVLTVVSAGRLLGVSRATAYKLAKNGQLPTLRLSRRLVVPKAALERMLSECKPSNVS
jgi:excisionase family DNA binding protein